MTDATIAPKSSPAAAKKPRQGRSPAFPYVPLGKALERAEALRVAEGGRPKHFSPRASVAKAWGTGEKTGQTKQTIAALGHFGLFEFQGSADNRGARLTDVAFRILLDKQPISPEREALVRQVAMTPSIHAELWGKWQANLPSDSTLETYLCRDRGFSEGGARDLIAEYKATLAYAKMLQPGILPVEEGETQPANEDDEPEIEVGDIVQREVGGVLSLEKPSRVRAIQEHEGRPWVFIEGSNAGIPMEESRLVEKGGATVLKPLVNIPTLDEIKPSSATEREWLRGPLSKNMTYRLIVTGDPGPKEIGKLITLLKAQKTILSDVDDDEDEEGAN